MPISKVKTGSISDSAVTSAKIQDGSIVNADINACAAIASSKLTVDTSALETDINTNKFNISLLGFKMAVNEGLTVFNLVDGVVDEFNDESGTDEAEGSNDTYCATCDFYQNKDPDIAVSAGFTTTSITEPDTSTAGTNPTYGDGTFGVFTVPCGVTSITAHTFGAGGGNSDQNPGSPPSQPLGAGGGGGYASGNIAVTGGQALLVVVGEGGGPQTPGGTNSLGGGGGAIGTSPNGFGGGGGGLSGIFIGCVSVCETTGETVNATAPQAIVVAGSGAGMGAWTTQPFSYGGGGGGGLIGYAGSSGIDYVAQSSVAPDAGGGGGGGGSTPQSQGGQGAISAPGYTPNGQNGGLFTGGDGSSSHTGGGGGSGYYGGGGGAYTGKTGYNHTGGGGGSSYYGHPQVTCGTTFPGEGPQGRTLNCTTTGLGEGAIDSVWAPQVNAHPDGPFAPLGGPSGVGEGVTGVYSPCNFGQDGYVLIASNIAGATTSTTIVSNAFTSTSVATSSRIVVFEENIDTPTLNTDIIASVSRDGGTTFTNATLSDSGYVTGSSGQRILTGQADISGQPSGQSMRWKLALANNTVKIHGVSLQWS